MQFQIDSSSTLCLHSFTQTYTPASESEGVAAGMHTVQKYALVTRIYNLLIRAYRMNIIYEYVTYTCIFSLGFDILRVLCPINSLFIKWKSSDKYCNADQQFHENNRSTKSSFLSLY